MNFLNCLIFRVLRNGTNCNLYSRSPHVTRENREFIVSGMRSYKIQLPRTISITITWGWANEIGPVCCRKIKSNPAVLVKVIKTWSSHTNFLTRTKIAIKRSSLTIKWPAIRATWKFNLLANIFVACRGYRKILKGKKCSLWPLKTLVTLLVASKPSGKRSRWDFFDHMILLFIVTPMYTLQTTHIFYK